MEFSATRINDLILKENSIFISDSHFKKGDENMLEIFKKLNKDSQVILMGDIFHLLIGNLKTSRRINYELIDILKKLELSNEIIYLEGNHDFFIKKLKFKNIRIFPRKIQPIIVKNYLYHDCILAHGDIYLDKKYEAYRKKLDNRLFICMLKLINFLTFDSIHKYHFKNAHEKPIIKMPQDHIESFLKNRKIIYKQALQSFIKNNLIEEKQIFIIEGHFHLGKNLSFKLKIDDIQYNIIYHALSSFYFDREPITINFRFKDV